RTREAAADVDDVDGYRRFGDRGAHAVERLDVGERRHRLAADVEAYAERVAMLANRLEKRSRIKEIDAELGSQRELRMLRGDPQAHEQVEIGSRLAGFIRGR